VDLSLYFGGKIIIKQFSMPAPQLDSCKSDNCHFLVEMNHILRRPQRGVGKLWSQDETGIVTCNNYIHLKTYGFSCSYLVNTC